MLIANRKEPRNKQQIKQGEFSPCSLSGISQMGI